MNSDTIKNLLASIGLGDGENNTSITRVIALLFALGVVVPKFWGAIVNHQELVWDPQSIQALAIILGGLGVKTIAEGVATKLSSTTPAPVPAPPQPAPPQAG